ncbi:hypothetical protein [Acinetobacter sp. M5A5_2a]
MRRKKFSKDRFYRRLNAKQQVSYEPNFFESFMIDFAKGLDKTVNAFKDMVKGTFLALSEMSNQQLKDLEHKLKTERK